MLSEIYKCVIPIIGHACIAEYTPYFVIFSLFLIDSTLICETRIFAL